MKTKIAKRITNIDSDKKAEKEKKKRVEKNISNPL